jgi:uncharacterized protein YggE
VTPIETICSRSGTRRDGPSAHERVRRLVVALVAALVPATVCAQPQESSPTVPTIVTSGEATVSRPPDVAYLTLAVEARARNPRDAQQQNAVAMSAVRQQLTNARIPTDALRTLGLWLEQEFDNQNGRRVARGFVARNTVEVRIEDVARAGEVADAVVQGGATALNGIRFDLKDRGAAEREALRLAVADARQRADAAAAGAGRTVDRLLKIEESRGEGIVQPRMFALRAEAGAQATSVEPGLIEIRARVTLTVSMK